MTCGSKVPERFAALYRSTYRTIESYVRIRTDDIELARDLAAETFAIAWAKYSSGVDTSISWLLRTARNLVGNEYQRREHESERLRRLMLEELTATRSHSDNPNHIELCDAMGRIRPVESLVLKLTYWYGLSAAEGAQFLGCSTASFWQQMTRARAALRRELTLDGPGSTNTAVCASSVHAG